MRFAVVSDIHANLQAWNAVLLDIRSSNVDKIICLGDIVGYGPNPSEVLESVYANVDYMVLGNHDAVVCDKLDSDLFNDEARNIILWTKDNINENAVKFLDSLPLTLSGKGFRCAHGDFSQPSAFNYIIDPDDAVPSWDSTDEQIMFVGHSHQPGIFLLGRSGTPRKVDPQDFELEPGKRYIVNVGSAGQPRHGDPRGCYCIFDTSALSVCWRQVPFDIDVYKKTLEEKGVSAGPSYFLRHDPRSAVPPIRELLNFSPAESPEQTARNVTENVEIETLRRTATRWCRIFWCFLIMVTMISALTAWMISSRSARRATIGYGGATTANALVSAPGTSLLKIPETPTPTNSPVEGWSASLDDQRHQSFCVQYLSEYGHVFAMQSSSKDGGIRLISPKFTVQPDMKFQLKTFFRMSDDFEGNVSACISVDRRRNGRLETIEDYVVKQPDLKRRDNWNLAQQTFELPDGAEAIQFQIRGKFKGIVLIRETNLSRKIE